MVSLLRNNKFLGHMYFKNWANNRGFNERLVDTAAKFLRKVHDLSFKYTY